MKKLKLEIDTLAVESFAPGDTPESTGTVHGRSGDFCNTVECPSFRICPPTDPSYNPCPSWDAPCG